MKSLRTHGGQQNNNKKTISTMSLQSGRSVTMSYTDTAISRSPQAPDIDELPCSEYAASAMWVHNKL